jgi:hypothetical protein
MEIRCADFRFHFLTTAEPVGSIGASSAVRVLGLHQSRHPKNKGEDRGAEADTAMQAEGGEGNDSSRRAFSVDLRPHRGEEDNQLHGDKYQVRPVS